MSLLSLDDARDQCRAESDYPAAQLQPYIDAAEAAAAAYLNRNVYADDAALEAAQDEVTQAIADASAAYTAAQATAAAMTDPAQQRIALELACARFDLAKLEATRTIHGVAANAAILAAVRLLLGHLFANREDVLTGNAQAVAIPMGAQDLLRPYRRVMMP